MSTPVICASADFFPPACALKNQDKMRLPAASYALVLVFHSGFHRIVSTIGKRMYLAKRANEPKDALDDTTLRASLCLL